MPQIETLAIEINEKTWPVAVACLPPMFATIPFHEVNGCVLIINEFAVMTDKKGLKQLVVGNSWCDQALFRQTYRAEVPPDLPFTFTKVVRI